MSVDAFSEISLWVKGELERNGHGDDAGTLDRLIRTAIERYERAASNGIGDRHPLADPVAMHKRVRRAFGTYGPLDDYFGGDSEWTDLLVVGGRVSWFDRSGFEHLHQGPTTFAEVYDGLLRWLADNGVEVNTARPRVDFQTVDGRYRGRVAIAPTALAGLHASIRAYVEERTNPDAPIANDTISAAGMSFCLATLRSEEGCVAVSGAPGVGKSTLANALLSGVDQTIGKTYVAEDPPELSVKHLHAWQEQTRPPGIDGTGGITLADLVYDSLRMRLGLLVIGEVRDEASYALLKAGSAGSSLLFTVHGASPRDALEGLVDTAILAQGNLQTDRVRRRFARIVDVVVHMQREPVAAGSGGVQRRQVMEIAALPAQLTGDEFVVTPIFRRAAFGAPLEYTGNDLPPDLDERLGRSLAPLGVTLRDILEGRRSLL